MLSFLELYLMKKKNKIGVFLFLLIVLLFFSVFYIVSFYDKNPIDMKSSNAEFIINSDDLVAKYTLNETESNTQFSGKIIEVFGEVKHVTHLNNRNTVILYSKTNSSGVLCDMHPSQIKEIKKLNLKQKIIIKGVCKGFLKDVILLNCFLIHKTPNE